MTDLAREKQIHSLFDAARKAHPQMDPTQLMIKVWPRRPRGATAMEMARIAREYELPKRQPGEG